jgi:hypothetical protein
MSKVFRLLMIVGLLLFSGSVFAQETEIPVVCGDLSEEDCAILTQAQQNALTLESASFNLQADFTISNIPDTPFESLTFNLAGDGAYALEPGAMSGFMEFQSNPAALFENMEQLGPLYEEFFNSFAGELNLTLTLPTEVTDLLSQQLGSEFPQTLSVDLRLVEGIGYINLDQIATALPQAGLPEGWYGLELARLFGMLMEQSAAMMDPSAMEGFDMSSFSQFTNPEFIGQYATVERLEDQDGAAVFQTTFDYAGFITSPEFRELMEGQFEAQGQALDEAEIDEAFSMMETMFSDVTFVTLTYVDLATNYVSRAETSFSFDTTAMMEAAGDTTTAAPVIDLTASIDYADFNTAAEVTAPEDVETVLTAEQAMQLFGMGAGAGATTIPPMTPTPVGS